MFHLIWRKSCSGTRNIRDAGNAACEDNNERRSPVRRWGDLEVPYSLMRRRQNGLRHHCVARLRTADSTFRAISDQPARSFAIEGSSSQGPITSLILAGLGTFRFAGRASKVPKILQGTTGIFASTTSIPSPCLKGIIEPVRVRPPSGKMMKIAFSCCNLRRNSARACGPQFFRHMGKALSTIAENTLLAVV